ncbi:MAG: DUF1045 domain-containing protein [Pseudomonadota bacterium]
MSAYRRYSIFYTPPEGTALAAFGASWLGWDAGAGRAAVQPAVEGIDALTATPRKYGFHGTLKPPFRALGDPADLIPATAHLAGGLVPFDAPALRLTRLGRFLALSPSAPCRPLADLAFACVSGLDRFRAPPTETELARRRAAGLSAAQDAMLRQWGYPYVGAEFRFHLTLTGALDEAQMDGAERALRDLTAPFTSDLMAVTEICLFGEIDGGPDDGRFRIIRRFPLCG